MSKPNVGQKKMESTPYSAINTGEEKGEEISDAGAKMTSRQVAEDYIATHEPATKNMENY